MPDKMFNEAELEKLLILHKVKERRLTQKAAGEALKLSERQVRRLLKQVAEEGNSGIKSKKKGGNRAFKPEIKEGALKLIGTHYADYGPTLAAEKLLEDHQIAVNKETVRQWMIDAGYWKRRRRKKARIHQSRERRARFGEMVQIDGSHHDWFEGRGPKCCLLVFVDDAASQLVGLLFQRAETTLGYMQLVEQHLKTHGCPVAYYSDKHSIFKKTREQCVDGLLQDTQLQRALRTLKIELICAHSPQAKGRVERANKTLQDRLVKEMRERKINTIEEANRYAPQFIKKYNKKFGIEAADPENAHRPVVEDRAHLRRVLSMHDTRRLTKNLEFSLEGKLYQIRTKTTGYRMRYKQVEIFRHFDGGMEVFFEGKSLEYRVFEPQQRTRVADSKEVNLMVDALVKGEWAFQAGVVGEAPSQLSSA